MMRRSTLGDGELVKTLQPTMLRVNAWGGVGNRAHSHDSDFSKFDAEPWEGPLPPPPERYAIDCSVLSDAMEKLIVDAGASGLQFHQARSVNPNLKTEIARSLHLKVRLFGDAAIPKANTALIKGTVVERAINLAPEYGVGLSFGLLHLYHLLHPSDLHVDYDKLAILRGLMPLFGDIKGLVEVLSRGDRCARKALRVWIIARGTMMFTETVDLVGGRAADAQMLDAEGLEASSARPLRHGMAMDVVLEAAKALGLYARWTCLVDLCAAPRASNLPYDVALQGAKLMRKLEIDAMPEPCAPPVCFAFDDGLEAHILRLADRDAALVVVDTEASEALVALGRAYMATASRHDQVFDKFVADDDEKAARAATAAKAKAVREATAAAAKAAREATAAAAKAVREAKKAVRDAEAAAKKAAREAKASVKYYCSVCEHAYETTSDANPLWTLARHSCPQCGALQYPEIEIDDISLPTAEARAPDDASTLSHAQGDGASPPRPRRGQRRRRRRRVLLRADAPRKRSAPDDDASTMSHAQGAALLELFDHVRSCPGRHQSAAHARVCAGAKFVMLHARDCDAAPGTCGVEWCGAVKGLLSCVVRGQQGDKCVVCAEPSEAMDVGDASPPTVSPDAMDVDDASPPRASSDAPMADAAGGAAGAGAAAAQSTDRAFEAPTAVPSPVRASPSRAARRRRGASRTSRCRKRRDGLPRDFCFASAAAAGDAA
ncbi:hypothetical protein JL720_12916 [Aureococcus anophagefferens]|nr:hypothetical protein JL720_12916 [Aureococcus anophagefferens]